MMFADATGMMLFCRLGAGLLVPVLLWVGCGGDVAVNPGSSGGGSSSSASSGTGVGSLPGSCQLPQVAGPCDGAMPSYWHDPETGVCVPFLYGGCEGNENRFPSLAACQEACHGGVPDLDTCAAPIDCVLAAPSCCGACDPVDASSFVALNRAATAQYEAANGCAGVACGACQDVNEIERTSQYFTATCDGGRCVVLDVRESPLTQCATDTECVLRDGVACCEGCDGAGIVALNQSADLGPLVCGGGDPGCPPCAPLYPPGMQAVCVDGRCRPALSRD